MFTDKKRLLKILFVCAGAFSFVHASVPNAPGYVGANKLNETNTSVRISFEDNSIDENKFYISVYNYSDSTPFATITANASNGKYGYANITGLTCDKTYQATVVANNQDGNSSDSSVATFNIQNTFNAICPTNPNLTPKQPGPYIGVTAIDEDNTSAVRISLKDNSDNEDGFRIFNEAGIDVTIPANDESIHPYVYKTLTGLTCTQLYNIQAVAYKGSLKSLPTPKRSFRIESTFEIDCGNNNNVNVPDAINPTNVPATIFD